MSAPLDLDALEDAARGEPSCVATWCAIGMSSTILELIRRLRAAEAEIEVERCLSFRSQVAELQAALSATVEQRDGLLAEQKSLGAAIERQHSAAEQLAWRVMQLEQQHDELLLVLEGVEKRCAPHGFIGMDGQYLKNVRAAIAAVRGASDDGPGEEDGPWAAGWDERCGKAKGGAA